MEHPRFTDWIDLRRQGKRPPTNPDAFELDWWLETDNPGFGQMVQQVSGELDGALGIRRHHPVRETNLRALLASLLDGHDREPGKPTKYARRTSAFSDKQEDRPTWASVKILKSLVDGLVQLGYVDTLIGEIDRAAKLSRLSLVWPLEPLIGLFDQFGLTRAAFAYPGVRPPVVLKTSKTEHRHERALIHSACPGAAHVIEAAAEPVRRYNEFMSQHRITLDRMPDGLIDHRRVNLSRTDLYRVFNNVDPDDPKLDQGGRFYGGGWQSLSQEVRPYILIDGKPTVELDYVSLHPRMLYNLDGLESPADPYEVPGLSRDTAKGILTRLINANRNQISAAYREPREDVQARWGISLPSETTLRDAVTVIETQHAPIAHHFFKGKGVHLQYIDSQVCSSVIFVSIMIYKTPILPIHDSFVIKEEDEKFIRELMEDAYRGQVSHISPDMSPFYPQIKTKIRTNREPVTNHPIPLEWKSDMIDISEHKRQTEMINRGRQ